MNSLLEKKWIFIRQYVNVGGLNEHTTILDFGELHRPHAHLMDFHPAIHECWRKNRLLLDFYPWIKICIWMHTHPSKPMIIHE